MQPVHSSRILSVHPLHAVEGGRIVIAGHDFPVRPSPPDVRLGGVDARLVHVSPHSLTAVVPEGLDGGRVPVRVSTAPGETAYVDIGVPIATGLHQVDNPAFDDEGNLYVTFSGSRGQQNPVSLYVVRPDGTRQPFVSGLPNPTAVVGGPDGHLYVSSRFDGCVYRVTSEGSVSLFASDLGVACGIAFGRRGELYVGDRSGSVLMVEDGRASLLASIPPSVAAFHLAFGPDGWLYVSAPTLNSRDEIYRIGPDGAVEVFAGGFGRPQGLAFDGAGRLYVADSLAGDGVVFRLDPGRAGERERFIAGGELVGLAFDPAGGFVVASAATVYRFEARRP